MKKIILFFLAFITIQVYSQNESTFEIEALTKPEKVIRQGAPLHFGPSLYANIEKISKPLDSLVCFEDHSFLGGILTAYKEHRPFVISPDIIWLLISQGFAHHISNNAEEIRKAIVNYEGKKELTVLSNKIKIGYPNSNWEDVFPQFITQISDYTGKELTDMLTANFSTTTLTTKIVSQITVMEAVKTFFKYRVIMLGCGIPKITIEGTIQDWEAILKKISYISKFKLEWWTSELEPIIKQIIKAKTGNFDKEFWMNMVQFHRAGKNCTPDTINGWIAKFFPYTKEGKRTNLKTISEVNNLPSEIVKVPFIFIDSIDQKSYSMEFWAGFFGLSQNKNDFTLKPEIGWAINRKADTTINKSEFNYTNRIDNLSINNVVELPKDIYSLKEIDYLHISFLKDIIIPVELSKIKILNLELNGHILPDDETKIREMFPNTKLIINGHEKR